MMREKAFGFYTHLLDILLREVSSQKSVLRKENLGDGEVVGDSLVL